MRTYQSPKLNAKTSTEDQAKLVTALKGVAGVKNATLNLATSQFEITPREKEEPKRADIAAAASKAGFDLAGKK